MAKQLLKERFQELAGIKPLYENTSVVNDFIDTIFAGMDEEAVSTRIHSNEWVDMWGGSDIEGHFEKMYNLIEKGMIDDPHGEISFSVGEDKGGRYIDANNKKYLDSLE